MYFVFPGMKFTVMFIRLLAVCTLVAASEPSSPRQKRSNDVEGRGSPVPPALRKSRLRLDDAALEEVPRATGYLTPTEPLEPLSPVSDDEDYIPIGTLIEGFSILGPFKPYSFARGSLPPKTIQTTTPAPCKFEALPLLDLS